MLLYILVYFLVYFVVSTLVWWLFVQRPPYELWRGIVLFVTFPGAFGFVASVFLVFWAQAAIDWLAESVDDYLDERAIWSSRLAT